MYIPPGYVKHLELVQRLAADINCKCILIKKENLGIFDRVPLMELPGIEPRTVHTKGESATT